MEKMIVKIVGLFNTMSYDVMEGKMHNLPVQNPDCTPVGSGWGSLEEGFLRHREKGDA